jgi:methyl-accepting chemotaxis protein
LLQQGAKEASSVMESSRSITGSTQEKADEAKQQLVSIVNDVNTINQVNSHIAHSTAEQNGMISSMLNSIEKISDVADQTAAGATQTAASNQQLLELSNQLCERVRQFKV